MEPNPISKINDSNSIDIWELWTIARKNIRPIFTAFVVIVFFTGFVTYFFIPKKYKSSEVFYIQEKNSGGLFSAIASQNLSGLLPMNGLLRGGNTNADLCSKIIHAPSFLKKALKEEKLPNSWKDVENFSKKVNVDKDQKSEAITLTVLWKDPVISYKLTKRLFINYKKFVDQQINNNNSENRQFIESQYKLAQKRLAKAEDGLLQYQRQRGLIVLPDTATQAIEEYAKLEEQKAQLEIGLNDAKHRLHEADLLLSKKAPHVKDNVFEAVNPLIMQYKQELTQLEVSLAKARETLTDEHPTVKMLLKQISELKHKIRVENQSLNAPDVAADYMKAMVEVAGLEAQQDSVHKVYNELKDQLGGLPDKMLSYGQLLREQKVAEQIYIMLSAQLEQAKISEAKDDNVEIQVIQPAIVPYKKYSPSSVKNMAIVGVLTLFIGLSWAVYKEKYNTII